MKKYSELTTEEKIKTDRENIKDAIILQCADDGFPFPVKIESKEYKPVPMDAKGELRYFPQIYLCNSYRFTKLPILFKTAEDAIDFVRDIADKVEFPTSEDSEIFSPDGVKEISAQSIYMFSTSEEKTTAEKHVILSQNDDMTCFNREQADKFNVELDAFNEQAEKYYDDYNSIIREYSNMELLYQEYQNYLQLCDGHKKIAQQVFCNARPGVDFSKVVNFNKIEEPISLDQEGNTNEI